MSEQGDKLRELAELEDEKDVLTDELKRTWLSSQMISDEYNIATNLSKEFKINLSEAKKALNYYPQEYTIEGQGIPALVKQLRLKRRELKGGQKIQFTKAIDSLINAYSEHIDSCIKSIYWAASYEKPLRSMTFSESHLRKMNNFKNENDRHKVVDLLCKYWEADIQQRECTYTTDYAQLEKTKRTTKRQLKDFIKSSHQAYSPKEAIGEHITKMVCNDPGITCRELLDSLPRRLHRRSTPQMISKMAKKLDITIVDEQYFKLNIKKDINAYTAAFIDSDGYITVDKNCNPRVGLVATGNRGKAFMIELHKMLGVGKLHLDQKSPQDTRPVNRLNFYSQGDIHTLLTKCRSHFRMKGPQADLLLELIRIKKGHKKTDWCKDRQLEIFKLMKWYNHGESKNYDWGKYDVDIENITKYESNCKMNLMDELEGITVG